MLLVGWFIIQPTGCIKPIVLYHNRKPSQQILWFSVWMILIDHYYSYWTNIIMFLHIILMKTRTLDVCSSVYLIKTTGYNNRFNTTLIWFIKIDQYADRAILKMINAIHKIYKFVFLLCLFIFMLYDSWINSYIWMQWCLAVYEIQKKQKKLS